MKVAVAHNFYRIRGGEDGVVEREIELLKKAGHEVACFFRDSGEAFREGGLRETLRAAGNLSYRHDARAALSSFLRKEQPDILHVHNTFPLLSPSILDAAHEEGVPVVMTLHNFRLICANGLFLRDGRPCEKCLTRSPLWGSFHACYRGSRAATLPLSNMISKYGRGSRLAPKVSRFIALSDFSRKKFEAAGIPARQLVVKPNYCQDPGPPPPWAERKPFALYVGRFSEEKGIKPLLAAWHEMPLPLKAVGTGPLFDWAKANRPPQVELLGPRGQQEVRVLMREASLLVVPSICYENFPLVLAEAWANGLPVLANRLGSLESLIQEGSTGLFLNAASVESIRGAVRAASGNSDLLRNISAESRRRYVEDLTPATAAESLMKIYRAALGEGA